MTSPLTLFPPSPDQRAAQPNRASNAQIAAFSFHQDYAKFVELAPDPTARSGEAEGEHAATDVNLPPEIEDAYDQTPSSQVELCAAESDLRVPSGMPSETFDSVVSDKGWDLMTDRPDGQDIDAHAPEEKAEDGKPDTIGQHDDFLPPALAAPLTAQREQRRNGAETSNLANVHRQPLIHGRNGIELSAQILASAPAAPADIASAGRVDQQAVAQRTARYLNDTDAAPHPDALLQERRAAALDNNKDAVSVRDRRENSLGTQVVSYLQTVDHLTTMERRAELGIRPDNDVDFPRLGRNMSRLVPEVMQPPVSGAPVPAGAAYGAVGALALGQLDQSIEPIAPVEFSIRPGGSSPVSGTWPHGHPPAASASIVLAQVLPALPGIRAGGVEISLNPQELGRVRITLNSQEARMLVTVQADRPETLELLRRHSDQLAAELSEMGFADATFAFSGQDRSDEPNARNDDGAPQSHSAGRNSQIADQEEEPVTQMRLDLNDTSSRVDIRI